MVVFAQDTFAFTTTLRAGALLAIEFPAGLRARLVGRQLLLQTLAGAALGSMIILLKLVLR